MAKSKDMSNRLNAFLSDLAVENIKIHNLHWNVVGREFVVVHKLTEQLYMMLQEQYDQVAEVMKMEGQMPLVSMADYLENTSVEEIEGRDYPVAEVLELLDNDCNQIMDSAMQIRDEADKADNFIIVNLMEDYLKVYAKHSWFIRSMMEEDYLEDDMDDTETEKPEKK